MSSVSRPTSEIEVCCWPACRQPVYDDPGSPPFCGTHLIRCAVFVSDTMDFRLLGSGQEFRSERERKRLRLADQTVVYYLRLGQHIKIGTTSYLAARLDTFRTVYLPDDIELLGTERGSHSLERQRHAEFAAERVDQRREMFNPSRRLLAHIAGLSERLTA